MGDFIDYAILGISTFKNSFPYSELLTHSGIELMFKIVGILVPFLFLFNAYIAFRNKDKNLTVLIIISLQNMLVVYPLCDVTHFLVGAFPILATTVYSLYLICEKDLTEVAKKVIMGVTVASMLAFTGYSASTLVLYAQNAENDLNHFAGIPMSKGLHDYVVTISDFIKENEAQGKEVYIADLDAVVPMIVADKYHKHFEMLTKGNMGSRGEDGVIADMEQMENTIFLISPEPSNNRQSSEKIRSHIQNNYTKVGTILRYDIYEK